MGDLRDFTSALVKDRQTGEICLQVKLPPYEATLPLPDHLATASEERLKEFGENLIPEMVKNLRIMKIDDERKQRRKLAKIGLGK